MNELGLYIHIPFCDGKCNYCDFYSISFSEEEAEKYIDNVCSQIAYYGKKLNRRADTLYFGGGTPGLLGTDRLTKMLNTVKKYFKLNEAEITVEVNPRSSCQCDFEKLYKNGFNRLSVGMQSSNEDELKLLGRRHNAFDCKNTVMEAKKAGFNNISLDLMLGIPLQTEKSLKETIDVCLSYDPAHISAYILKIEENTPFHLKKHLLPLPDEDNEAELCEAAFNRIQKSGFERYEISNFAKQGFKSRHNLKYWNCHEYLGIGASAHSFINGKRFYTPRSFNDFYSMKTVSDGNGGSLTEYIMLCLRLKDGLVFEEFQNRFENGNIEQLIQNAEKLAYSNLVVCDSIGIRLTEKGMMVSNAVILKIIEE